MTIPSTALYIQECMIGYVIQVTLLTFLTHFVESAHLILFIWSTTAVFFAFAGDMHKYISLNLLKTAVHLFML